MTQTIQAYKAALEQLLAALAAFEENAVRQYGEAVEEQILDPLAEKADAEPQFSARAAFLLEELDSALEDIDMLTGKLHPRVEEMITALEALNEAGIDEVLTSVRTAMPLISAVATTTVAYVQAYEVLEDSELMEAESVLDQALAESSDLVVESFLELEAELERQMINESFAPVEGNRTIH